MARQCEVTEPLTDLEKQEMREAREISDRLTIVESQLAEAQLDRDDAIASRDHLSSTVVAHLQLRLAAAEHLIEEIAWGRANDADARRYLNPPERKGGA
jgi:hypothetical protein